jgi:FAD/FMN-containing dehydrogenase
MTRLDTAALEGFQQRISGEVITSADPAFDSVRRIHNGMIDRHPAVIVRCIGVADVIDAIDLALSQGLEIAVRGGGHNVAGRAVCDNGLMIDLSLMKGSWVDPRSRKIRVEGGVTWGEFNRATQVHGLAATGGAISSTGVAGLTLGGGFGYLMGKLGLTIDNLHAAELVTARGEVVRASSDENDELFWGLRGGGGNFGVVTSFEFDLHAIGREVNAGMIAFPFADGARFLDTYREVTTAAEDDFSLLAGFTHARDGSGTKLVAMLPCHCGPANAADRVFDSIRSIGSPVLDTLAPMPYTTLNELLDPGVPKLDLYYWKSCFVDAMSDEVGRILMEQFEISPSPKCKLFLEHFHGAAIRPDSQATAFPHRKSGFSVLIIAQWTDASLSDACIAWARETYQRLLQHSDGGVYSNYMDDDENTRLEQAYGPNLPRLRELKNTYDPDNVFHLNQNIPPSR